MMSKTKYFLFIFFCIFKIEITSEAFAKKRKTLIADVFPEIPDQKNILDKCLKNRVLDDL